MDGPADPGRSRAGGRTRVYQDAYDRARARGWGEEAASRAGDRAARMYRSETIARTETKTAQNRSSN